MTSRRISRSATITLHAPPAEVFPLFGAIKEAQWAEGWNPEILYSESGEMEKLMVFRTKPIFTDERDYLWIVSIYEPDSMQIEYTVSTDQRIWTIAVQCRELQTGLTEASIAYTYTGLSEVGIRRNAEAMKLMFASDLNDWEEAINGFLRNGTSTV
jgi:hypothetical protein